MNGSEPAGLALEYYVIYLQASRLLLEAPWDQHVPLTANPIFRMLEAMYIIQS